MGKFWDWMMSNEPCIEWHSIDISEKELEILERMQMNKYKYDLLNKFPELKEKMSEIKDQRIQRERWLENN